MQWKCIYNPRRNQWRVIGADIIVIRTPVFHLRFRTTLRHVTSFFQQFFSVSHHVKNVTARIATAYRLSKTVLGLHLNYILLNLSGIEQYQLLQAAGGRNHQVMRRFASRSELLFKDNSDGQAIKILY